MALEKNHRYFAVEVTDPSAENIRIRRRNARLPVGARCIWFTRRPEIQFVGSGEILRVTPPKSETPYGPVLEISHGERFTDARTLDEMAGSLSRLKNPLSARRAFARQYLRLDHWDFDRIRVRYVDIARTVFRTLFFALPEALRLEFLLDSRDAFSPGNFPIAEEYRVLADRLQTYVRGPVAKVLTMSDELGDLYADIETTGFPALESLILSAPSRDRSIPVGRASTRIRAERGKLFPHRTVNRQNVHEVDDDGPEDEGALLLGIPRNLELLEKDYPPDLTVADAEWTVRRLKGKVCREAIL